MGKQHTTHQHYVPRFLLANFSDDGVHVYELDRAKKSEIRRKKIRESCFQNDLYEEKWKNANEKLGKYVLDNQIEEEFAILEDKVAPFIKCLINEVKQGAKKIELLDIDKQLICEFIALLFLRNPNIMKNIMNYYLGVENEQPVRVVLQEIQTLFDALKFGNPKSLFEYSKKAIVFNKDVEGAPYIQLYKQLINMKYVFWFSQEGGFMTASFPLHIITNAEEHPCKIVFPVSSELAIVLFDPIPDYVSEGMVMNVSRKTLEWNMKQYFNSYIAEFARFFIAKEDVLRNMK